ncbi:zinc-dependent alcohol dehydrogenase family protein [Heyndrickxia ginsengihumi]|uniref:zinc-dependent alcohol dehydrogenase family protein n=1 Tax=Heyndrickxia ginsengihumi TaxID=363870 RepID=UPI002040BE5B|nr:zinc-dependent alcohol dehydrogenase family protein [Heyndrickxia ginsengihumi]MCM3023240.1 zinc-dependent alcohol dehydrogenase family protein [Heyndrickxia ginsengihumi]
MKVTSAVLEKMGAQSPYEESKPIVIRELELDAPGRGEVLIEIKAAGLCHSDLSVINGSRPRPLPMALGHEAAGVVVETGEDVNDLQVGDHVVCIFVATCGHCAPCQEGRPALCEEGAKTNSNGTLLSGAKRLHDGNHYINHHLGVSAFSSYVVTSRNSLVKIDPSIPFEKAALFGCAVMTGVGAVVNTAKVKMGNSVAVVGLGGVGLSALLGAIAAGAREVIAVDINPSKLAFAKTLGATHVFNSRDEDVIDQIKKVTDGGVEFAFETAGAVPAMKVAYHITRRGGTTTTTGLPHPDHEFSFPQVTLTADEKVLKGSYLGSCVPSRDIPRFIELYKQGRLPVDKLLSDVIPLEKINEGFDRLTNGEVNRIVVTP